MSSQLTPRTSIAASEQLLMAALLLPVGMLTVDAGIADIVATLVAGVGLLAGVVRAGRTVRGEEPAGLGILQRLCILVAWGIVLVAALTGATITLSASGATLAVAIVLGIMLAGLVLIEVVRTGSWVLDRLSRRREASEL